MVFVTVPLPFVIVDKPIKGIRSPNMEEQEKSAISVFLYSA